MKLANAQTAEIVTRAVTEYSPEVAEQLICEAADSPSMTQISARVGVPIRTLRYWLQLGREGDPRYEYFAAEFDRARATHEDRYLKKLEEIAQQTDNPKALPSALRALTFMLKTLYPKQYGDQLFVATMIEHKADSFDLSVLPTDVMREFHKVLKVIRASNDGEGEERIKSLLGKIKLGTDGSDNPDTGE